MKFEDLQEKVIGWASARQIIPNAKPYSQLLKAFSEMGELADAELKDHSVDREDAIGDVFVCLIIYCRLTGKDPVDCLEYAYNQIKDRTGTLMPNGTFVKD